jgi:hypothetical protein
VATVLRKGSDWQEGEHALANHATFGPWLESETAGDELDWHTMAQSIIRDAETILGQER